MEYKSSDSLSQYQQMAPPQPGFQGVPNPQPPYQQMPYPQPGDQSMPPPQQPYQQMPSPLPSTSVIVPPVVFRDCPMQVTCGNCGQSVTTTVIKSNGTCAYLTSAVISIVCCPFFWVPLTMDSCKDYRHVCPSCNAMLGIYKKI